MDLTRTERLLLETAAEMFDIGLSPAEAAVKAVFELTPAEQAQVNGCRPQLGDLLVGRGLLTPEQLGEAFDRVFDELQGWSDSLATPEPAPIPRPAPEASGAQMAELVKQLASLLDVLVGATPSSGVVRHVVRAQPGTVIPQQLARSVRPKTQAEINLGDNLLGQDPGPIYDDSDDDEDTAKLAEGDGDEDEDTRDAIEADPPTSSTLQVERAEAGSTLQIERPEPEGSDEPSALGKRSDDTLQLERPAPQGA